MTTHRVDDSLSRRSAIAGFGVTGLGLALAIGSIPATAQEASPSATATHSVVGTWFLDFYPTNPGTQVGYASFHAGGTRTDLHPLAGMGIGAWRSTDTLTGETVVKYQNISQLAGEFIPGTVTVWESFTVDEAEDSLSFESIVEMRAQDGEVLMRESSTAGPLHRLSVELPPLETPEATPAT